MGRLQQYQAEKMVQQATWTSSNNIKSWYSSKEGFVISLGDYKRIVYFELLPPNLTINSVVYIEQLTKLNNAVEEKRLELTNRKCVVFHRDDARPHASLVTRQKLLELGCDVLPHPPYSPDLAPSDYFLFRSLQNFLNDKNFNNDDDIKSYLIQFFANKNQKFHERGITMLAERWQKVNDQKWATHYGIKLFSYMKKLSLIF